MVVSGLHYVERGFRRAAGAAAWQRPHEAKISIQRGWWNWPPRTTGSSIIDRPGFATQRPRNSSGTRMPQAQLIPRVLDCWAFHSDRPSGHSWDSICRVRPGSSGFPTWCAVGSRPGSIIPPCRPGRVALSTPASAHRGDILGIRTVAHYYRLIWPGPPPVMAMIFGPKSAPAKFVSVPE